MHVAKGLRSGLWSGEGNTGEGGRSTTFCLINFCASVVVGEGGVHMLFLF